MAEQIRIPARADVDLIDQVRDVANRQGWTLAKAMEIAMRRLVVAYDGVDVTALGLTTNDPAASYTTEASR